MLRNREFDNDLLLFSFSTIEGIDAKCCAMNGGYG